MVIAVLGPVLPNIILEVFGPLLCSWVVGEDSFDNMLMLKLMVISMFENMDTICKVSKGYMISTQKLRFVLLKMLFNFFQVTWEQSCDVGDEMLIFLFVGVEDRHLEFGGLNKPGILRVNKQINLVRLKRIRRPRIKTGTILSFVRFSEISNQSASLTPGIAILQFHRWQLPEWSTEFLFISCEILHLNIDIFDFIVTEVEVSDNKSWEKTTSMCWEVIKFHLFQKIFIYI